MGVEPADQPLVVPMVAGGMMADPTVGTAEVTALEGGVTPSSGWYRVRPTAEVVFTYNAQTVVWRNGLDYLVDPPLHAWLQALTHLPAGIGSFTAI